MAEQIFCETEIPYFTVRSDFRTNQAAHRWVIVTSCLLVFVNEKTKSIKVGG